MKAVVIHETGGPEKLIYEDIDTPEAGDGEVLINLSTVGLNRFDLDVRGDISGYLELKMPHILGVEGAGVIADVGAGVRGFKVGDRVMPQLTTSSGRCDRTICNCALGLDNICLDFAKLGISNWGTYAEYVKVTEPNVIRIPDSVSDLDAAATQVAMATAWELVVTKGKVSQGEDVLVNAAGSGVGSAAVQIAHMAGARVIATAGADSKLDRARQLGASDGINYNTHSIVDEVTRLTDGRGVDVVIEMVGGNILQQSLTALAINGRLSTAGAHAGEKVEIDMIEFFRKQLTMTSTHFAPVSTNQFVLKLVGDGTLRPVIEKVFPLKDMKAAHELLASRNFFGKVVLEV